MKNLFLKLFAGSVLSFLFVYNVGFTANKDSGDISLDILSSQAVVCSSECTNYSDCTISMDCTELCASHSNYFKCGLSTYTCESGCKLM